MEQIVNNNDLLLISGGLNVNGTIITAFVSGIKIMLDLGRSVGSAIVRLYHGKVCSI